MQGQETRSARCARFADLAPLLDRLRDLAENELPDPYAIHVDVWDDGDFHAYAHHSPGAVDGQAMYERIEYDTDGEAFVYRFVEWDIETLEEHFPEAHQLVIDAIHGESDG